MKKLLTLCLLLCSAVAFTQSVNLSSATQEDLLMIQKEVANDIVGQKGKVTAEQVDILSRISKTSNSATVSFSKVPRAVFDDDLRQAYSRCSMFFSSLPEFVNFKKALRKAYSQDTSVVTRVIMLDKFNRNNLPKQYFVDLAKTRD